MTASKDLAKTVARLDYLRGMLSKYSDAYHRSNARGDVSSRLCSWIDEYNEARFTPGWLLYCSQGGWSESHDAYDCMA
jgi:hypothetical protein